MELRVDLVYSYWLFVWFLLFQARVVQCNPKWFLLAGILVNLVMLVLMTWFAAPWLSIALFVAINVVLKVWPLTVVWNQPSRWPRDLVCGGVLFAGFAAWLQWNHQNLSSNAAAVYDALIHGRNRTPLMALLARQLGGTVS